MARLGKRHDCFSLHYILTLNLLNSLNRIIQIPFLVLSITIFRGYQNDNLKLVCQQYRAWFYTGGKSLITFRSSRIRVNQFIITHPKKLFPIWYITTITLFQLQGNQKFIIFTDFQHPGPIAWTDQGSILFNCVLQKKWEIFIIHGCNIALLK